MKVVNNMGLVVRTVGIGGSKNEFLQDLRYLTNLWRKIKAGYRRKAAPALIHEEYDLVLRIIRDKFSSQTSKLWVDCREEYKKVLRFLSIFAPSLRPRIQFYRSDAPLFESKGVEDEISRIYDRKVALRSGGHIVIEPTESLVAIDVNSGRFTRNLNPEETSYQVNLEAAREIARQIRLRDLGGIIIIDFIDMRQAKHRQQVYSALVDATRGDYAKIDIQAVSKLGLIEMTRQRVRKSLESVAYQFCEYCHGKGLVKSDATMAILGVRRIKKMLLKTNKRTILVFAHPKVGSYMTNENRQSLYNLERHFKAKILIRHDPALHMEDLKIEAV